MAANKPINEFGLTEVASVSDPLVDVVLVHGLNGSAAHTWATHTTPEVFWPRDLLPLDVDQERCRILVYGYDANVSAFRDGTSKDHIHHHAETLAARLAANRSRLRALERPLIFICHSLGGLVVKRMLIYSSDATHPNQERIRSIFVSTYGILFLGTPHMGSDIAKWGSMLQAICAAVLPKKVFDSSSQLIKSLETNNETLQVINREFTQLLSKFHIYFFHEARPMDLKGTRQFIVDEDSAAPNLPGVERAGIEKDHSNMCKFEDESAPGYDLVSEAVQRYAADAPGIVSKRWQVERRNKQLQRQDDARELLGVPDLPDIKDTTPSTTRDNSTEPSRRTSIDNSASSSKLLGPSSSVISHGPLLVAPLGFRPNSVFKGFKLELTWMDWKLKDERKAELGTSAILLSGPPGCGKSHLARQYVWLHRSEHPAGTFWIDSKSMESTVSGFWDIGRKLGCLNESSSSSLTLDDPFIDTVRTALQEQHGWILVFDGILFANEDSIDAFIRFLPDSQGNKIIYTSVDRTLARRQRLLVPSGLQIRPLSDEAALELLYSSLSIRKPTSAQKRKAQELIRYYRNLPLGIHAAAYALIARGRALERFSPGPSDNRLAQPFHDILTSIREGGYKEAIYLITLLSFIWHRVPVALIQFGAKFLAEKGYDVESLDANGGIKRHIDNTIAVLISRGLIERQLQPLNTSSDGESSPESSRKSTYHGDTYTSAAHPVITRQISQESTALKLMLSTGNQTDSESLKSTPVGIDTIKAHSVVQAVIRDDQKADLNRYYDWLVLACRFLKASFQRAKEGSRSSFGQAAIADLHEYKTQAQALYKHFPAAIPTPIPTSKDHTDGILRSLFDARHDLRDLIRAIDKDIESQSPKSSSSSQGHRPQRSVFERSASSSDDGPYTPRQDLSRSTTWSLSALGQKMESPMEMAVQPYPDVVGDDASGYGADDDDDAHELDMSRQWSVRSDSTMVTEKTQAATKPGLLETILIGNPAGAKKDLGEYKRRPSIGPVQQENATPVPGTPVSSTPVSSTPVSSSPPNWWADFNKRRASSSSPAERSLAAFRVRSRSPQTHISPVDVLDEQAQDMQREYSSDALVTPPASEPSTLSVFSRSPQLQQLSKSPSSSPRLLSAVLSNQQNAAWERGLPYEENITITRRPINVPATPIQITSPVSPPLNATIPEGYSSAIPMSRDMSNESHMSSMSLPARPSSMASSPQPDYEATLMSREGRFPSIDAAMSRGRRDDQLEARSFRTPYPMSASTGQLVSIIMPLQAQSDIVPMPSPSAYGGPSLGLKPMNSFEIPPSAKPRPRAASRA